MSGAETIAAIATAPGRAGVAVVRVSGPEAFVIAEKLTGRVPVANRIHFVRVRSPGAETVIDEAVMLAFVAPHSYTGEDVVEIQCHGGSVTPRRVLECCLEAGARLARRGEFTERAFLNGKLDYHQSESVLRLIDAKTDRAADAALAGLAGRRARELRQFYEQALEISSNLEHALDVDESDLPADFWSARAREIEDLRSAVGVAVRRAREGKILNQGALVVLAGPPNVGKSSLMNALLRENRAIVSATAGTTRDVLEEWLDLDGWPIRLADTAGLRDTEDEIEAEGVRRAEALIARADVIVRLTETAPTAEGDVRTIDVWTKADLLPKDVKMPVGVLAVSAKTGQGLEDLRRSVVRRLEEQAGEMSSEADEDADVSQLAEVLSAFGEKDAVEDPVLLGNQIRRVADRLGVLIGAVYSADLLDRLFSRFCVGK